MISQVSAREQLPADSLLCQLTLRLVLCCISAEEVHLLPQLCIRHPVPTALWRPLGTLPALMWQLESSLLADQLLEQLVPEGLPADK